LLPETEATMRIRILLLMLPAALPVMAQGGKEDAAAKRAEVLAAIDLPKSAQALRKEGVDKAEVKEALRAAKGKKAKAKDTKALLDESAKAVKENGRIDNFGAFVKSKLNEGLRGRELAAAIHAEHKARGKGKGKSKEKSKAKSKGEERPGGKPEDKTTGKPEGKGRPEGKGKPEDMDEPEEKGGKGKGKRK
jgi:hypothetical protein